MARVPITVMGFRCERCGHEWIPRGAAEEQPRTCPKCRSPYWDQAKKERMTYDVFKEKIERTLRVAGRPLTWTEIRTEAGLPQLFPNNQWVHRLERDISLQRHRESDGMVHWHLVGESSVANKAATTAEATHKARARPSKKQGAVE
jgi:hypothetical protein